MQPIEVAIGIVVRDGMVLIARRRRGDGLGGYWEFPGGKREPGESVEECLIRELREEIGLAVRPVHAFAAIDHAYADRIVRLYPYLCQHLDGQAAALAADEVRWVASTDLLNYRFPAANDQLIPQIIAMIAPTHGHDAVTPQLDLPKPTPGT